MKKINRGTGYILERTVSKVTRIRSKTTTPLDEELERFERGPVSYKVVGTYAIDLDDPMGYIEPVPPEDATFEQIYNQYPVKNRRGTVDVLKTINKWGLPAKEFTEFVRSIKK